MSEKQISKGKKRLVFIAFIGGLLHILEELLEILQFIYNLIF